MSDLPRETEKRVDESWKEQVEQERRAQEPRPGGGEPLAGGPVASGPLPPVDFQVFLSSLSMQAMVALGELPNPATRKPQVDLDQARYLIDVLGLLQEKTRGNLTPEEADLLEGLLYELRMRFVAKQQGGGGPA